LALVAPSRRLWHLREQVRRLEQKAVRSYVLAAASAAFIMSGCDAAGPNPHLRAFACDRGFRAADWGSEATREMTAQSIDQCGWLEGKSRRETMRLLGEPDDGGGRHVSWLTGYDDAWIGTYSYLNIGFADGRIRYVESSWGE
jgi:hypothetical protein